MRSKIIAGFAISSAVMAASGAAAFAKCDRMAEPAKVAACLGKENQETMKTLKAKYSTMLAAIEKDCTGLHNVVTPTSARDIAMCIADKLDAEKKQFKLQ